MIAGRKGACRFGSSCLIAGFSIWSFETNPTSFVCEFSSGKRFTISFTGSVVETACYTAAVPDSITIEVDGVRSETITTDDPEPSA